MSANKGTPLVEMRDISISFGGVHAVDRVSVDLYPGEVVGVLIVDDQPKCWSLLNFGSLKNCGDGHRLLQQVDVTQLDQLHSVGLGLLNGLCVGAGSEPGLDLAVSDRSLLPAHVP